MTAIYIYILIIEKRRRTIESEAGGADSIGGEPITVYAPRHRSSTPQSVVISAAAGLPDRYAAAGQTPDTFNCPLIREVNYAGRSFTICLADVLNAWKPPLYLCARFYNSPACILMADRDVRIF